MTYICCKGVLKKESNDFIYVTENLRLKRSGHHTTDSLKLTGDDGVTDSDIWLKIFLLDREGRDWDVFQWGTLFQEDRFDLDEKNGMKQYILSNIVLTLLFWQTLLNNCL